MGSTVFVGDTNWKDYELEFEFKIVETFVNPCKSTNLAFGVRSDDASDTGFFLGILTKNDADGADWERFLCNQWVQGRKTANFPVVHKDIKQKVWHKIRMVVDGASYQVFWNDDKIVNSQNATLKEGGLTFYLINAQIHFDNLRITGDTIPDRILVIDSRAKFTTTWATIKTGISK